MSIVTFVVTMNMVLLSKCIFFIQFLKINIHSLLLHIGNNNNFLQVGNTKCYSKIYQQKLKWKATLCENGTKCRRIFFHCGRFSKEISKKTSVLFKNVTKSLMTAACSISRFLPVYSSPPVPILSVCVSVCVCRNY